ncbi:hypothetical protein H4582DRAFT_2052015 [Lactarius indigo]|nr:hypothetical protein H4582DRAFT_2052015 [Lactarius indigo]
MTPFTSDLGVPPGCLDFRFRWPASLRFRWQRSVYLSKTFPPPSPSDDLRPPSSYRRRGVVVGCRSEKRKAGQDGSGEPVVCRVLAVERRSIYSLSVVVVETVLVSGLEAPGTLLHASSSAVAL